MIILYSIPLYLILLVIGEWFNLGDNVRYKISKYWVLALVVILSIVVVFATTSIPLPAVQRYILTYVQQNYPELEVKMDGVYLVWDRSHYTLALSLKGNKCRYTNGEIEIDEVRLSPRWLNMVKHGTVHSLAITLSPVTWKDFNSEKADTAKSLDFASEDTQKLLSQTLPQVYAQYYHLLRMIILELPSQKFAVPSLLQQHVQAKVKDISMRIGGEADNLELLVSGKITMNKETARGKAIITETGGSFFVDARIQDIPLNWLDLAIPTFYSNVTLQLNITAQAKNLVEFPDVQFALQAGAGYFSAEHYFAESIQLDDFGVHGAILEGGKKCHIPYLNIQSNNVKVKGDAYLESDAINLHLQTDEVLSIKQIQSYWPNHLADDVKQWISESVKKGVVKDATLSLQLPLVHYMPQLDKLRDQDLKVQATVEGAELQYLPYVSPITNITGTLDINADQMQITVQDAHIANSVIKADCYIGKFSDVKTMVNIKGSANGTAQDAITLAFAHILEGKPIEANKGVTMQALTRATGNAATDVEVVLGLQKGEDLGTKVQVHSTVKDVVMNNVLGSYNLTSPQLIAVFKDDQFHVEGDAEIEADVKMKTHLNYTGNFSDHEKEVQVIQLQSVLDEAKLQSLGIDVSKKIQGSVVANLKVELDKMKDSLPIKLAIDMQGAQIELPLLGLKKRRGDRGELTLAVDDYKQGRPIKGGYKISMPDFMSEGVVYLNEKLELSMIEASTAKLRDSNFAAKITKDKGYNLQITGNSLDLSGLDIGKLQSNAENGAESFAIATDLQKLIMKNQIIISKPKFSVNCSGRMCEKVILSGELAGGHTLSLAHGAKSLIFTSSDAGQALAALGITQNMRGGVLLLEGKWLSKRPADGFEGTLTIENYYMRKAPLLAKLLTISAITSTAFVGLVDVLENKGMQFKLLTCKLLYKNGILYINDLVNRGPVLGMTGQGEVDLPAQRINMRGVIVPENIVNSVIKSIPLFGQPLSGGKYGGVIASSYVIRGNIDEDLSVEVNPLSVLTPGFLKQVFGFD